MNQNLNNQFNIEEKRFLKKKGIDVNNLKSKWSWLYENPSLIDDYFISTILPYFIMKPDLTYAEIDRLGFNGFRNALKRGKSNKKFLITFSQLKEKYIPSDKEIFITMVGKDIANRKLERAEQEIEEDLKNFTPKYILKDLSYKARLAIELSDGICVSCNKTNYKLLPALETSHLEEKRYSWRDLRNRSYNYEKIKSLLSQEKIILECSNCHLKRQTKYFNYFQSLILDKTLFKHDPIEIDNKIDEILKAIVKNESSNEPISKLKFYIKRWIRKRFVFKQLYGGKCLYCHEKDLRCLTLHHRDIKVKNKVRWKNLRDKNCKKIIKILKNQNCICLCSNCHSFIDSSFHNCVENVFKSLLKKEKIREITKYVRRTYKNIINKINKFEFSDQISDYSPLDINFEKILLLRLYFLKKVKSFPFFTNSILDFIYSQSYHHIYTHIEGFISKNLLATFKSLGNDKVFRLSKRGNSKIERIIKNNSYLANIIKRRCGSLNFNFEELFSAKRVEKNDNVLAYIFIIQKLIEKNNFNEFTISQLMDFIPRTRSTVLKHLKTILNIGFIKLVDNSKHISSLHNNETVYKLCLNYLDNY